MFNDYNTTYLNIYRYLTVLLLLLTQFFIPGYSQKNSSPGVENIHGIINSYAKVISKPDQSHIKINPAFSRNFKPDDTIMIVQMKGADIDTTLGTISNINLTGKYEFVGIEDTLNGTITLRSNLLNFYDTTESLQIVRVPSYLGANVDSTLTCLPWNAAKGFGGILAFIVSDAIVLNADINVTGKGFNGGALTFNKNGCDSLHTALNYLNSDTVAAGLKGEGITSNKFIYTRGIGNNINGGGGGNGNFNGGGGGAGYGSGGYGGNPPSSICKNHNGGSGGQMDITYIGNSTVGSNLYARIFMGGGGG